MAQRPTAGASEGRPARSGAVPTDEQHVNTQRIVVSGSAKDLPAWFWGAVGCFSVLAVGLTVLFIIARPTGAESATAAPAPSAVGLARGPGAAAAGRGGIQVEPMASPPAATTPLAAARPRAMKVMKVARTASRPSESTPSKDGDEATEKPEAAKEEEPDEEELLRPRGRSPAPAEASE